ncbi:hypothetical protein KSS82_14435 [Vibrio mimicus]|uniref:hypothetical protein n=1 Tax=Vibrio sp. RC586 TaxID=675815 RepID=UPI0001BB85D3|nr:MULTISPECIES: hypothetical protein [Vibrio]EEZ00301.1 hypothetical protein VOA_000353 [Vibrio sp. RC586]QXC59082.1 hypothetical protein KSS82_14435 [Vibrio mimicus]
MVDNLIIAQLKKEFYAQLSALQAHSAPQSKPTLSVLTDEELSQLEQMWIELCVWKKSQN